MKKILFVITAIFSAACFASEAVEHAPGHSEIPLTEIGWQAANLGILLIVVFFLIRKSIVETFVNRKKSFIDSAEKTKTALKEAEAALADNKAKLNSLESGEKKALENAQYEATILQANLVKDAELQAEKIKKDSQEVIKAELEKAKAEINTLILDMAIGSVKNKISNQSAQGASESEFLKQIAQVKS